MNEKIKNSPESNSYIDGRREKYKYQFWYSQARINIINIDA